MHEIKINLKKKLEQDQKPCAGLFQNTIITAAHCCDGQQAARVKVVAGEHSLRKDDGTEQVGNVPHSKEKTFYCSF